MSKWEINLGGKTYQIPALAVSLMLVAILVPSVKYSFSLNDPTPPEILVAISIGLFASVLFLWILDATSILPFRAPWISKSVYGAAIVSILGTSVGVYKDFFAERKHPFEGEWILTIMEDKKSEPLANQSLILMYSESADFYWGYSDYNGTGNDGSIWFQVEKFTPEDGKIDVYLYLANNTKMTIKRTLQSIRHNKGFVFSEKTDSTYFYIDLSRRK